MTAAGPDACFIAFTSKGNAELERLVALFGEVKAMKEGGLAGSGDNSAVAELLTETERSHFWRPTPEEMEEWPRK
jgi:hypothetical protein